MTYTPTVPYADLTYANAFMSDRVSNQAWDDATDAEKTAALKTATRAIDNLNFAGDKADEDQVRQFPRGIDSSIPDQIAQATVELALALLDAVDPNLEIENLANSEQGIGDFRTKRDTSFSLEHIANGIPSIQAWGLLKPFLRTTRLHIDRG